MTGTRVSIANRRATCGEKRVIRGTRVCNILYVDYSKLREVEVVRSMRGHMGDDSEVDVEENLELGGRGCKSRHAGGQ